VTWLLDIFTDYTLRTVALGAGVLGIISGALGVFAVLRRQSLLGDAVSHAALPGICIAFLLTGTKSTLLFMVGAAGAGLLGTLVVLTVVRNTPIKEDAALGVVLAVFFGFGLVLLTYIQGQPEANQAGLDRFLFGQAAAVVMDDVLVMAVLGATALSLLFCFWKEFKLVSFDADFGQSLGLPVRRLEIALTALIVVAIVVGLQTVGVVLMSALLVAPALAARQWTDRLAVMVVVAGLFGLLSGTTGAITSSTMEHLPTGPVIVLTATVVAIFSLLMAPRRGIVWGEVRRRRDGRRIAADSLLLDLLELGRQHDDFTHGHAIEVVRAMSTRPQSVAASLSSLAEQGWVQQDGAGGWVLTERGLPEARRRWKESHGEGTP
jgi:manganese/zinc/iron transport system permease protein